MTTTATKTSVSVWLFFAVCFSLPARAHEHTVLDSSTQLIVVTTADWKASHATLQRYERADFHEPWKSVGDPIQVVTGRNGLGWGAGAVSTEKVRGKSDPVKKEGDGKAPAGVFLLSTVFGYDAQEQAGWKMPYVSLGQSSECVDDTSSQYYNRLLDRSSVSPDWHSSEQMLRPDGLYRWGIFVSHNATPPQPGGGSCIFMHIWMGPDVGTSGCTAMAQPSLESVLAWLDPAKTPLLVQLPTLKYKKLRHRWKLPKQ